MAFEGTLLEQQGDSEIESGLLESEQSPKQTRQVSRLGVAAALTMAVLGVMYLQKGSAGKMLRADTSSTQGLDTSSGDGQGQLTSGMRNVLAGVSKLAQKEPCGDDVDCEREEEQEMGATLGQIGDLLQDLQDVHGDTDASQVAENVGELGQAMMENAHKNPNMDQVTGKLETLLTHVNGTEESAQQTFNDLKQVLTGDTEDSSLPGGVDQLKDAMKDHGVKDEDIAQLSDMIDQMGTQDGASQERINTAKEQIFGGLSSMLNQQGNLLDQEGEGHE